MKDAIVQYRFHGRFISAARASQLSHLKNASAHVSTSVSYRVDSSVASKMTATGEWKESRRKVREREAPPPEVPRPVRVPVEEEEEEEEGPEPVSQYELEAMGQIEIPQEFEPGYDYEKAGFESPWTDDSLFYDDEWEAMDWDGDIADQDVELYV